MVIRFGSYLNSGNYRDNSTWIWNSTEIKKGTGSDVRCSNNIGIAQTGKGEISFNKIPAEAQDVQVFDNMNAPLTSTGKLVKWGGVIVVMDKSDAHALTSNTKNAIRNIISIYYILPQQRQIRMISR